MAEQGTEDISKFAIATLLGESTSNISVKDLCNSANQNPYSFYKGKPATVDAVGKWIEFPAADPTEDFRLGDFRRYDDNASEMSLFYNPAMTKSYPGGASTVEFIIGCLPERLNLYEASNNDPMYWRTEYYTKSTDRKDRINLYDSYTDTSFNILDTEDNIPPGHSQPSSKSPSSSTQLFTDPAFDLTGLTDPDTVYCDTFIVASGGTDPIIRVGTLYADSYLDIVFSSITAPYHRKIGVPVIKTSPPGPTAPPGFTVVLPVVTTNSSSYLGIDQTYTNGDTNWDTYWYLAGLSGSTWYRLGSVSCSCYIAGVGTTSTQIFNSTLTSAGASSNEHSTGDPLGGSETWDNGDVGRLEAVVNSWTGYTSYALPGYPG